jgi:transposase-like protein
MNTINCPACGETTQYRKRPIHVYADPGAWMEWTCPECKTRWRIETQYHEQSEET